MGTDPQIESRLTAMGGAGEGGMERKGKRTHGHGQQYGIVGDEVYKGDKWQWNKTQ